MESNIQKKSKNQQKSPDSLLILAHSKIHIYQDRIEIPTFTQQISSINSL